MSNAFQCNLCDNKTYKYIPFRYLFKDRHIRAARCKRCGLISLFPLPSDEEIHEMYSSDYFTVEDKQTHHYQKDYLSAVAEVDYSFRVDSLKGYLPENGSVLEVGCATGELLLAFSRAGYSVTGVEISEFAAKIAKEQHGLYVIVAPFDEESTKSFLIENSFDMVLMGDVLEHFKNPTEAMRYSLRLLKTDGVLIVNVPSTLNLISSRLAFVFYKLIGSQKTMTIPPYHLTEFFPATLRRMYKSAGFLSAKIIQETKHPKTITLRHSVVENLLKVGMQYPNYLLTKWFGVFGDRLTGIGRK